PTFEKNEDVFETGIYLIKAVGNLESYEVSISDAPAGTKVVKLDNNQFKLTTDANNITEGTYDLKINVTGKFSNIYQYVTEFISSDKEVQNVAVLQNEVENQSV
ncbi:hypothetical protein COK29_31605, partial [Bacillus cereus]|uniref:hypothetical protein n=1 Tax=Bacillus cereus TaxID=1396 RepID=UPI000C002FF9